jgi:hypothetical protein
MKTNRTLSSFAIATIGLLAAAAPSFAQAHSHETDVKTSTIAASTFQGVALALNRNPLAATPTAALASESRTITKAPPAVPRFNFSPAAFMQGIETPNGESLSLNSTVKLFENSTYGVKPQFRADEQSTTSSSRVSFTPSRQPNVPW